MPKSLIEGNPELNKTGRTLAFLALEQLRQDGSLVVRQREQLRRALAAAGEELDWNLIPGGRTDRAAAVKKHVTELAEFGAEALDSDLVSVLEEKRAEIDALEEVTSTLRALAEDPDAEYPAEVEYSHTARDGQRRLVTKTETVIVADADEATSAAAALEKKLEGYTKLRDQMLEHLEQDRRQIDEMRDGLGSFVAASNGLVLEVLATLT